jgi:hypothetical protein
MLSQAVALPATPVSSLVDRVANPSSARVTNDQAVTIDDRGTAGNTNHLTTCGPPSAYPFYGFGGTWINFPDMFNNNKQSMRNNGATDQEIGWIYDAINTVAANSFVDRRVVGLLAYHYLFCFGFSRERDR